MLQSMGSQRVGHDWETELNWTEGRERLVSDCYWVWVFKEAMKILFLLPIFLKESMGSILIQNNFLSPFNTRTSRVLCRLFPEVSIQWNNGCRWRTKCRWKLTEARLGQMKGAWGRDLDLISWYPIKTVGVKTIKGLIFYSSYIVTS